MSIKNNFELKKARQDPDNQTPVQQTETSDEDLKKLLNYQKQSKIADIVFYGVMIVLCLLVVLYKVLLHPVRVTGDSMAPTYKDGQILITDNKVSPEKLSTGAVVVFKGYETGDKYFIKRIIGIPGDTVTAADGKVFVNGVYLEELNPIDMENVGILENQITLEDNQYFVMGDNRNNSNDSRFFGPVAFDDIDYVVVKPLSLKFWE